jgi:ankyrin repeat protein
VRNNRHGDVEDMLTGPHAVDPDIRDAHGNTVLAVATQNNRKRIVKAAVRAGVPLDAQNTQGQTAMHFAYAYGYDELAEYLIRKGANPMVTNCHGMRPDEGLSPDRLVGGSSKG